MDDESTTRGRGEFAAIIAIGAAGFLFLSLFGWSRGADLNWVGALGRPVILAGLGGLAWQGRLWARTVAAAWLAVIGALVLGSWLPLISTEMSAAWIGIGVGLVLVALALALYRSPHIKKALAERQRLALSGTIAPPAA